MIQKLILLTFVGVFWGCTQQEYLVGSDQALDTDLTEYNSFNFSSQAISDDGLFTLNDAILKAEIREAIEHEMIAHGYELNRTNGELMVNFRVFDEPTEYTGFEDNNSYWQGQELVERGERRTYELEAGTLMIDIIDKETGKLVWTGYASGILEGDSFDRSEESIVEAVNQIFEELR